MRALPLLIASLLIILSGCQTHAANNSVADAYTRAITDFIKAANEKNKTAFDTLYIIKRHNGQPDDFPDIELPQTIANTHIVLLGAAQAEKEAKEFKTRVYINLMGWVEKETAEFIFVVFSNGFAHQYDYNINYTVNVSSKQLELSKLEFKGPPFH
ncbi:MAG: hypothetical protein U0V74_12325 [Chitinophagales bacterium]